MIMLFTIEKANRVTDDKVVSRQPSTWSRSTRPVPQQAYHDLALASPFTAPDGMPLVTRMAELIALNRHPPSTPPTACTSTSAASAH